MLQKAPRRHQWRRFQRSGRIARPSTRGKGVLSRICRLQRAAPRAMSRLYAPIPAYCSPGPSREMWDSFCHILQKVEQRTISQHRHTARRRPTRRGAIACVIPNPPPQIAQTRCRNLTPDGNPEFEISPHRQFAGPNPPKISDWEKSAFDINTSDAYSGRHIAHFQMGLAVRGRPLRTMRYYHMYAARAPAHPR